MIFPVRGHRRQASARVILTQGGYRPDAGFQLIVREIHPASPSKIQSTLVLPHAVESRLQGLDAPPEEGGDDMESSHLLPWSSPESLEARQELLGFGLLDCRPLVSPVLVLGDGCGS